MRRPSLDFLGMLAPTRTGLMSRGIKKMRQINKYTKPKHLRPKYLGMPKLDKIIRISRPPRFPCPLAGGGRELVLFLHKTQNYKGRSHPRRCTRPEIHLCEGRQELNLAAETCNSQQAARRRSCQIGLGNKEK